MKQGGSIKVQNFLDLTSNTATKYASASVGCLATRQATDAPKQSPKWNAPTTMSLLARLRKHASLTAAVILPFFISSCAEGLANAQAGALSALGRNKGAGAQDKFKNDQARTVNEGTLAGAGVGAIAGAALYKKFGVTGILAGAAIGAIAGHAFGEHVAMKKALAAQNSANLDGAIKEAQGENAAARKRVSSLRGQLAQLKAKGRAAKARGDEGAVKQIKLEMKELDRKVLADEKAVDETVTFQTQLKKKVPESNSKYAAISSGLSDSTKTRSSYNSLHNEIGSALNEF